MRLHSRIRRREEELTANACTMFCSGTARASAEIILADPIFCSSEFDIVH